MESHLDFEEVERRGLRHGTHVCNLEADRVAGAAALRCGTQADAGIAEEVKEMNQEAADVRR